CKRQPTPQRARTKPGDGHAGKKRYAYKNFLSTMNGILGGNDLDFAAAQGNNGGTAVRLYKKPALFVHAQHGGTVSIGTSGPYVHMATRQGLAGQIIGQEIPTATAAVKRPESIEKSGSQPGTGTAGGDGIKQTAGNAF